MYFYFNNQISNLNKNYFINKVINELNLIKILIINLIKIIIYINRIIDKGPLSKKNRTLRTKSWLIEAYVSLSKKNHKPHRPKVKFTLKISYIYINK